MTHMVNWLRKNPIVAILLLALALRLITLEWRTLWYDEAFAVLFARTGFRAMLEGTLGADLHPLLYYTSLDAWMTLFGESAAAVRLWSVVKGVATVYLAYATGRTLFKDERSGLAAAFITAISPFHVQYSQETRMYSLLGLILLATTWCFVQGWRSDKWNWWIIFGVSAGLAMHTQQLAAVYLIALGLVPFLARRKDMIVRVVSGAGVAFAVYLPWIALNFTSQIDQLRAYWVQRPNLARPLLTLRSYLSFNGDFPAPASMIAFLGALFIALFLAIQVIIYLRSRVGRRANSDRSAILFALWLAFAPMALLWFISQVQPVYIERALLPSALAYYLALGWFFTRSRIPRPIAGVMSILLIATCSIGLYYHYSWDEFPNSPFRQAAAYIRSNSEAIDVVVHQNKLSALPMRYYDPILDQHYLADIPGSRADTLALATQETLNFYADDCIQTAANGAVRVWLVMFSDAPRQYAAQGRSEITDMLAWLDAHYTAVDVRSFNDLDVYLFEDGDGLRFDCE